ncbi:AAA family ATPase [Vagococcus carniphilus]|uniref:AAA family ATPase n=1 Tax=Vagococcus carniphilus TaxID=218144 RepID=UPI0028914751|nr:AAA family ATPase [Vagococcus carniphilus]MDT2813773.1 AAA family ATPase [Vagococcus carniphilus]
MEITKAKREQIKVPIMVTGASGSGKTVSSLILAKGIVEKKYPDLSDSEHWEKIGVIDTEHKRSMLYADSTVANVEIGSFLHIDLEAPFSVGRYTQAFKLLKDSGVEVIIVDSLTHAWSGEGGILEEVERQGKGNPKLQMVAWSKVKPLEKEFQRLVTGNSVYVIGTTRSKQAYEMEKDDNGRTQVRKVGLKSDQKDALEYEFAIVLRMDEFHNAEATKDNSNMFNEPFLISKEIGHQIYEWSSEGVDLEKVKDELITEITELVSVSDNHEKQYAALMNKFNNTPLKDFHMKNLKQIKELMEKVPMPQEQEQEQKQEE